jgi:3-oxoacyl-[acyl-carrier-protein] synthase II
MNPSYQPSGRVAVTGIGLVTPLAIGAAETWRRLVAGEGAIGPVTRFDCSDYPTRIAAEIPEFEAGDWVEGRDAKKIDRFMAYAMAATRMAMEDAAFPDDPGLREETGILIGSGIGGLDMMSEQTRRLWTMGPNRVSPFLVPYMIPDMASGYVSIAFGLKGPISCTVTACSTGANALGDAAHIIRRGEAVAMVAGGSEAPINPIGMSGFGNMRAMSFRNDDPARASRPFDAGRDGFVIGEGAAVMILEDYGFARSRGARIWGEIIGYGMSADANHITAPDPKGDGARRAMEKALWTAGIGPEAIDYINAHGTSTPLGDKAETLAIKSVFGERAAALPVSSTKSSIGHLLGAAGSVEAAFCLMAIRDGIAPPTINYEEPDPECDLDYVPNHARPAAIRTALSNSFGFGGKNVSLVLRGPEDAA